MDSTDSHCGSDANIKVCVRVRPPDSYEVDSTTEYRDGIGSCNRYCVDVTTPTSLTLHSKPEPKTFTFDYVADPKVSQENVFSAVGRPIIEGCMNGYNGTVFAYGQTGSGKTFTMIGPSCDNDGEDVFTHELRGLIPRSFEYLFSLINRERQKFGDMVEFLCKCCFIEIYNEHVFDLMDPAASTGLHLRENMKRGVYVDGIIEQTISTASEAYEVLNQGWINRHVASTSMNRESSRSHAVFMLSVESKKRESYNGVTKIRSSTLSLVDLAGSERQRDTNTVGIRLKEAGSINKSLSVLGSVMNSLVEKAAGKPRHVHYRDSKLTFLLRDSLGGNSRTNLIANVHPLSRCFGETFSTLQFARRAKLIKNKAIVNEDTTGDITQLQLEIKKLKETIIELQVSRPIDTNASIIHQQDEATTISIVTDLRGKAEAENTVLKDKISKLHELCSRKDKSLQAIKMILKLRDTQIAGLEKQLKGGNQTSNCGENNDDSIHGSMTPTNLLKEEVKQLKILVAHHPDVTKYAMDNQFLKAEISKLKHHEKVNPLEREVKSLREYTLQLEKQLKAVQVPPSSTQSEEGLLPSAATLKELGELNIKLTNSQELSQKLQSTLDTVNKQLVDQQEAANAKIASLEAQLSASTAANAELERNIDSLRIRHRIEKDSLNESHMKSIKALATPPMRSVKRCHSATSTPLQPLNVNKEKLLRQKLFFQPLSVKKEHQLHNVSKHDDSIDDDQILLESPRLDIREGAEQCKEIDTTTNDTAMWGELMTLQESNNVLRRDLELKEYDIAQNKSKESSLLSLIESHEQLIQQLREQLADRESQSNVNQKLSEEAISRLTCEKEVLMDEVRDLRLCLKSADKELKEVKQELMSNKTTFENKINQVLEKNGSLEQETMSKIQLYEKTLEELHSLKEEIETLQEEIKFKSYYLNDKEKEIDEVKNRLTCIMTENETLKESLDLEKDKVSTLVSQLSDTNNTAAVKLAGVIEERDSLLKGMNDLHERVVEYEKQLSSAQNTIDTLTSQSAQDQTVILELKSIINQLRTKEAELTAEIELIKQDKQDQLAQLNQCLADISSLKLEITDLEDAKDKQFHTHLKELKAWELQQEINEAQFEELQENSIKLLEVTAHCSKLEEELQRKEVSLSELQKKLSCKSDEIQALKDNLKKLSLTPRKGETPSEMLLEEKEEAIHHLEEEKATYSSMIMELQELLDEKDSEIIEYKIQAKKYRELQTEFDLFKTKSVSEQYKREADLEEYSKRVQEIENELTHAKDELQSSRTVLCEAEQEKNKALQSITDMQSKFDVLQGDAALLQDQLKRVRTQEEALFAEKENLRSQLEAAIEAKAKLAKENQEIIKENAQLSGHRNLKQRIQFHAKLKMDYHKLMSEHEALQSKCQHQADYINKLGGSEEYSKHQCSILKPSKENTKPLSINST